MSSANTNTKTIGPFHPYLLEPTLVNLKVQEGIVKEAEITAGYVHRSVEKLMMTRSYQRDVFLSERVCGICSVVHTGVFCDTVEKLFGVELPERAAYLRVINLELERLHSHTLWLSLMAHAAGYHEGFTSTLAGRETVMELQEITSGNRVNCATNVIGGAKQDISLAKVKAVKERIPKLEEFSSHIQGWLKDGGPVAPHIEGVGMLEPKTAISLGAVGPVLRASGIKQDIRLADPYAAYKELGFWICVEDSCDVLGRTRVRAREVAESIRLIERAIHDLPEGPILGDIPPPFPGEWFGRIEAPRGELVYYIRSNGTKIPERVKIRTPTFANMRPLKYMLEGEKEENVQKVIESIDPCISCTDR